ncbi:hypothetical protein [Winogradskyella tangerina]|uniref:hypothetical protein n=1 Tax=Winogradskyella tangerina TaxID=2023240 RepID=UPI000DBE23CF|nr:hypothetical protein [Winogradskyella tangerina]
MKVLLTLVFLVLSLNVTSAQTTDKDTLTSSEYKLKSEYNVMTDIKLETRGRYKNTKKYRLIEEGIYLDLNETDSFKYRMTISYNQVIVTTDQYPLEDILDEYLLYVSHEFKSKKDTFKIELGGDLEDLKRAKNDLIGKKVFNRDYVGEDGKIYVKLVVE